MITKKISVAADLSDDELETQVEVDASQYIPFPLEEVSLDFCVIGPTSGVPGQLDVPLAASRKEKVSDRQALAEAVGLAPSSWTSSPMPPGSRPVASSRPPAAPGRDALIALFEIGSHTTSLQVIRNDDVIYERDQVFGGALLTQQVAQQYGPSFEDADARKKSRDLPPDYANKVLEPFLDSLGQEVGRALQFFFTSTPHNKVDHILLSAAAPHCPAWWRPSRHRPPSRARSSIPLTAWCSDPRSRPERWRWRPPPIWSRPAWP